MAMLIKDNKIYILVADSDAVKSNKISISTNDKDKITGNYCPPENKEDKNSFYEILGNLDRPVYCVAKKVREYYKIVKSRVQSRYAKLFVGEMINFELVCNQFNKSDVIIANKLYLTGDRPYLQFDGTKNWLSFKDMIYGEICSIVIEPKDDKFLCYPEFHPMFIKKDEYEDERLEDYSGYSGTHFYGMHIKNKNTCLSEEYPHICLGWGAMGDLTTLTSKEDLEKKHKEAYPNNNNYSRATAVSMIYLFRFEMNINDIVVYFDGRNANIGRITSEYYYDSTYEGDTSDYGSKRNVEWIKSVQYSKLVPIFRSRTTVPKSLYRLDVFKSYILDLLNDVNYEDDNETDEYFDNDNQTLEDNVRSSFDFNCPNKEGQNLVVYGTPGCGKSYYVQHELLKDYEMVDGVFNHVIRTTFYQDYTNTDFVGQIMPRVDGDKVTYEFNPGPFTVALNMAIKNPEYPVALVIEELNRGNAASIFGDIFQLLDRENGSSVYGITNLNIQQYLEKENPQYKFDYIKLPSNFSIFATMNTSDQNVFTLDTAFKRRWKFEKLKNDFKTDHEYKEYYIPGMDMCWEDFCNTINSYMLTSDSSFNSEDKQLGVYFVDKDGLRVNREDASTPKARKEFAYKIFEYLWNDVSKFEHDHWFQDCNSLDDVIDKYINASEYENDSNNDGRIVFVKDVFNK